MEFNWGYFDGKSGDEVLIRLEQSIKEWGQSGVIVEHLNDWNEIEWEQAVNRWEYEKSVPRKTAVIVEDVVHVAEVEVAPAVVEAELAVPDSLPPPPTSLPEVPATVKAAEVTPTPPPPLDLMADVDYEALPVLPNLPEYMPSVEDTKQYKNYMRLRYEWQRRNPTLELEKPKPHPGLSRGSTSSPQVDRKKQPQDKVKEKEHRRSMEVKKGKK